MILSEYASLFCLFKIGTFNIPLQRVYVEEPLLEYNITFTEVLQKMKCMFMTIDSFSTKPLITTNIHSAYFFCCLPEAPHRNIINTINTKTCNNILSHDASKCFQFYQLNKLEHECRSRQIRGFKTHV